MISSSLKYKKNPASRESYVLQNIACMHKARFFSENDAKISSTKRGKQCNKEIVSTAMMKKSKDGAVNGMKIH